MMQRFEKKFGADLFFELFHFGQYVRLFHL